MSLLLASCHHYRDDATYLFLASYRHYNDNVMTWDDDDDGQLTVKFFLITFITLFSN
jgi:hypothetical protein